jgi:hypothetical protein
MSVATGPTRSGSAHRPSVGAFARTGAAGPPRGLSGSVRWVFRPALDHPGAFLAANLVYWGAFALGALYGAVDPPTGRAVEAMVGEAFAPTGQLAPLVGAYTAGQLPAAIALTFLVNLVFGAFAFLTLPSAAIPFAGLATGVLRALLWGVLFSPAGSLAADPAFLLHVPTILVEGEAYVLAITGVLAWWRGVLTRRGRRWAAWREGLLAQPRVYAGVARLLAAAALYEAVEVIYLLEWVR